MLSSVYDLPIVDIPWTYDEARLDALGEDWVGHQHLKPVPDLIEWVRQREVVILTTIRHPGDTFISFFHFNRNQPKATTGILFSPIMAQLALDGEKMGGNAFWYTQHGFFNLLSHSVDWILCGESLIIRYEDLWRDTHKTLADLTNRIRPASRDSIERAVGKCDFGELRRRFDPQAKFFRAGRVGQWYQELPPEIVEIFRMIEPYPTQFSIMGYTLDPQDPLMAAPVAPPPRQPPFNCENHFDNGVAIPPILVLLYFSVPFCYDRWPDASDTRASDSFFEWITSPADADSHKGSYPLITNLGAYLHASRPDLRKAFPDLFGRDRGRFTRWFLTFPQEEYALPKAFLEPVRRRHKLTSWNRGVGGGRF